VDPEKNLQIPGVVRGSGNYKRAPELRGTRNTILKLAKTPGKRRDRRPSGHSQTKRTPKRKKEEKPTDTTSSGEESDFEPSAKKQKYSRPVRKATQKAKKVEVEGTYFPNAVPDPSASRIETHLGFLIQPRLTDFYYS